ncbi:MAG TPA: hypothetical protein VFO31_26555 [Vicinamibacterales bacterium]|nr:hypothetical protein [Vicinamibacterales bacterium]
MDMVRELRAVLNLPNSARPDTPQNVWRETLDWVRRTFEIAQRAEPATVESWRAAGWDREQ